MTNAQMAHHMGLDKITHNPSEYREALIRSGMTITSEETNCLGRICIEAKIETSRGTLYILCGTNGTARIDKPNGTHKWVYEKTPNQIAAQLRQVLDFYK